jgi:uncharacterized protein (DUF2147 family)
MKMGSMVLCALFGSVLSSAAFPFAAGTAASIHGRWITVDRDAIVEVTACGTAVCGRIAKFLVTPPGGVDQRDVNNRDPKLRGRKIMGMMVLQNLKESGKEWKGTIYDPRSGKNYRSVVFLTKNGTLTVKGCLGPICQSQKWARAGS